MKIGIVGLPNVGKSTLFKAITKITVDISNYPFCTINPNVGVVPVPDERLYKLAEISHPRKTVPAVIEFVDIAGLVKGAAKGEGLGNKFLAHIREVDVIVEVVRAFSAEGGSASGGENITHIYSTIDPKRDIEIVETELILADLETISKRLNALQTEIKSRSNEAEKAKQIIDRIKKALEAGRPAKETNLSEDEFNLVKNLHLLTFKPVLYVYNISDGQKTPEALRKKNHISLDLKTEEEAADLNEREKEELGIVSGLNSLIKETYRLLGLITFFTTVNEETRAWAVKNGTGAAEAGGIIHTDFREKFIRANVINFDKLMEIGSWQGAREKGLLRTEGRNYAVQNGDVIEFKI